MTHPHENSFYLSALDGVRGIFCICIITFHWPFSNLKSHFGLMWWILQLFFILSAYLLTSILLREKDKIPPKQLLRKFYINRVLRIFPLYFFYLAIVYILLQILDNGSNPITASNNQYLHENIGLLLSYTYNFAELIAPFRHTEYLPAPPFAHLWSLSLEEQFYVFLPLAVIFLSNKNLKRFIILLIIGGIILRWQLFEIISNINSDKQWLGLVVVRNTFFQIDTFAYGIALAVFDFRKIKYSAFIFIILWCIWLILLIFTANQMIINGESDNIMNAIRNYSFIVYQHNYLHYFTLTNILCTFFLIAVLQRTFIARFFEQRWMINLGKVSYGMYVYQFLVLYFVYIFLQPLQQLLSKSIGDLLSEAIIFTLYIQILYLVSKFSFKFLESYFLKWKIHFNSYEKSQ